MKMKADVQGRKTGKATEPDVDIHDRVMDAYYGRLGESFMRETQQRINWVCSQTEGKRVLDVGCSQGIVPLLLAREGCWVTGVDIDPVSIKEAKAFFDKEAKHIREKINLLTADFLELELPAHSFDSLIITEVLEHLVRPELFIASAYEYLQQEGQLVITVPFGINDYIDHKHTFYLLEPCRMVARYFELDRVVVLGKWLGLTGRRRQNPLCEDQPWTPSEDILHTLEHAFFGIERELVDRLVSTQSALYEANKKYRFSTQQVNTFKDEIATMQSLKVKSDKALKSTASELQQVDSLYQQEQHKREQEYAEALNNEKVRLKAEVELEFLHRELNTQKMLYSDSSAQVEIYREHLFEAEKQLIRVNTELSTLQLKFEAQAQECKQLQALYKQVQAKREKESVQTSEALTSAKEDGQALKDQLDLYRVQLDDLNKQREIEGLRQERCVDSLEQRCIELDQAKTSEQQQGVALQSELDKVRQRLHQASIKYRNSTLQLRESRSQSDIHASQLTVTEGSLAAAEDSIESLAQELNKANQKYRSATGEEIPKLKMKLEEQYRLHRETYKSLVTLRRELGKEQQLRAAAEKQVQKTRATLSFQLGYSLIFGTKSLKAALRLPGELWRIHKESKARRKQRQTRELSLLQGQPVAAKVLPNLVNELQPTSAGGSPILGVPQLVLDKPLKSLKVACVMDEFTFASYQPECRLQPLTPEAWEEELDTFGPELLFIESAWRGKDEKWGNKVGHNSRELQGVIQWCRDRGIATLFWNKEDPVHFETFLNTAKQFDYVFTTDFDCIHRYKAALGHARVYFLPFACQPRVHNPIEVYERKDAFCFAGAYYVKYPERTRDLENFVSELPDFKPLEIYDRNYGKDDPNYQFPAEYQPHIVGTLPFDQIDKAYKGYRYAINLNSIKQSQTMFARRVYELLASNTVTISNFSRGVRLLFGDLVTTTDSGAEVVHRLQALSVRDVGQQRLRLAALRKVMMEHTYADRMAYLASKVSGQTVTASLPTITVIAMACSAREFETVVAGFRRQTYSLASFKVIVKGSWKAELSDVNTNVSLVKARNARKITVAELVGETDFVAVMVPQDYYGPNYLQDIALANRYSDARLIGKGAYFQFDSDEIYTLASEAAYKSIGQLPLRAAAAGLEMVGGQKLSSWVNRLDQLRVTFDNGLAIDPFNYCRDGNEGGEPRADVVAAVDDLSGIDTGTPLQELLSRAENLAPAQDMQVSASALIGPELAELVVLPKYSAVELSVDETELLVCSSLDDGKHEYLYANREHHPVDLECDGSLALHLETTPGLNLQLVVLFLDAQKQRISHVIKPANCNITAELPLGTEWIRLGLRVYAAGSARIKGLRLGHRDMQPAELLGQSKTLLLTNHYPSYEDLYRNGFVHSRVMAYREKGVAVDVFRLREQDRVEYHEFKDINVITGAQSSLRTMLASGQYKHVLVHFLDAAMWEVLGEFIDDVRVTVWVHGAEIQPWWRRKFNFITEDALEKAKVQSNERFVFWRSLLEQMPKNLELVFISDYLAKEVMEDLKLRVPDFKYHIIHNPIDTELFCFNEKNVEQRKKILSIRPYASRVYANDLSVKAVLELSKTQFFDELEFHFVGDGVLFEETLEPLRSFSNVKIEKRFLTQEEIADYHKEYGVFLCPSRSDTQGVSRDEAMSSGLVPITNAVAAIPEFVDDKSGLLSDAEDYVGLVNSIRFLFENPSAFMKMSSESRLNVISDRKASLVVEQELKLF